MPDFDLLFIPACGWEGAIDGGFRRDIVRSLMVDGHGVPEDAPWLVAAPTVTVRDGRRSGRSL